MIYLDTHIVVWLFTGLVENLSINAGHLINENSLFISPVVRLELQYLFEIHRITDTADKIMLDLSNRIGLGISDQSFNTIINEAMRISWTRDPFDRIIVANAAVDNSLLLTKDQHIL